MAWATPVHLPSHAEATLAVGQPRGPLFLSVVHVPWLRLTGLRWDRPPRALAGGWAGVGLPHVPSLAWLGAGSGCAHSPA